MVLPKPTHTTCRYMDDSVQATQTTTQAIPSLHLLFWTERTSKLYVYLNFVVRLLETALGGKQKLSRDGVACVGFCVACTLPSITYLVCAVLALPYPYIPLHFWKMFVYMALTCPY